jgi:hypothetical protein
MIRFFAVIGCVCFSVSLAIGQDRVPGGCLRISTDGGRSYAPSSCNPSREIGTGSQGGPTGLSRDYGGPAQNSGGGGSGGYGMSYHDRVAQGAVTPAAKLTGSNCQLVASPEPLAATPISGGKYDTDPVLTCRVLCAVDGISAQMLCNSVPKLPIPKTISLSSYFACNLLVAAGTVICDHNCSKSSK